MQSAKKAVVHRASRMGGAGATGGCDGNRHSTRLCFIRRSHGAAASEWETALTGSNAALRPACWEERCSWLDAKRCNPLGDAPLFPASDDRAHGSADESQPAWKRARAAIVRSRSLDLRRLDPLDVTAGARRPRTAAKRYRCRGSRSASPYQGCEMSVTSSGPRSPACLWGFNT